MSQERHLSEAQISAYLSAGPDVWSETDSVTESHLEECESCRKRTVQMHRDQMGFRKAGRMTRDCPEDEILQLVAAGGSDPAQAAKTVDHAARCSHCGPRLKKLANIFSGDLAPEQQKIMAQLQTSKPEWQREFIRDYVKSRGSSAKSASDKPGLWTQIFGTWWGRAAMAGATAAIVLAAVFEGPVLSAKYDLYRAQKLVASAYGERRTTETRFSGAPSADYKPYPTVLGPDDDRGLDVNRPELMKAEGTVADKVKGQDPRWFQLQGRISLLEATPKSIAQAQKYFEEAQRKGLNTPSLKIDLASSYYEHDVKAEYPNLQRTLDLLLEVLHQPNLSSEDKAAALFDLGIAYEKTQAWDLAASTWEDYLKVDSSSAWAEQARDRLKKAKEKIPAPKPQGYNQPIFFLEHLSQLKPEDPEEYQSIALSQWLPAALEHNDVQAREAVTKLADVLATQQADQWLTDFMEAMTPDQVSGVLALGEAVSSNETGSYNRALARSRAASAFFLKRRNRPGEILSRFEEVYALRSMLQGKNCLTRAGTLSQLVSNARYPWILAQLMLEEAQCNNFQGNLDKAASNSTAALSVARNSRYPVLILRIVGITAGIQRQQGKPGQAWITDVEGLDRYWQGGYPQDRLDQFYAVMWQSAEPGGYSYAAEALLRHTIEMRVSPGSHIPKNLIREGILHLDLANILEARKDADGAQQEFRSASALLDHAAESYAKDFRLTTDLGPAELELKQQRAQQALNTLLGMRNLLNSTQYNPMLLGYYRTLGNVYFALNRFDEASASYRSAVAIAEESLEKLKDAGERLSWLRATDESYRGIVRVLLAQNREREALEEWEWYKSRPLAQSDFKDSRASLGRLGENGKVEFKELSKLRQAGTLRLIYANFPEGLEIWAWKNDRVEGKWIAIGQEDFEREIDEFVTLCANPDSDLNEVQQLGRILYSQLLQPAERRLSESESVIIELDRPAYNLPIEALRNAEGKYIGETKVVSYSAGLWVEQGLRSPNHIGTQLRLLLLDAFHLSGASYPPGIEEEKRSITSIFPHTEIIDGGNISSDYLRSRLAQSDIFHYVGDGRQDGTGTKLRFKVNQDLQAQDFTSEALKKAQLVVLAACSTGVGRRDGLLDNGNLLRAMLTAGIPMVVASHWNVDSGATSQLMSSFYKHLAKNALPARAMYEARREALNAHAHPYYWASFAVVGRIG